MSWIDDLHAKYGAIPSDAEQEERAERDSRDEERVKNEPLPKSHTWLHSKPGKGKNR